MHPFNGLAFPRIDNVAATPFRGADPVSWRHLTQRVAYRCIGNPHHATVRLIHLEYQEDGPGNRQRSNDQRCKDRCIEAHEEPKSDEKDRKPENQDDQERPGKRTSLLLAQKQPSFAYGLRRRLGRWQSFDRAEA
jgi:hypothetical protein